LGSMVCGGILFQSMAWQESGKAIRPPACRETLPDPGKGIAPLGGIRKRTAFPLPLRDAATKTQASRVLWPPEGEESACRRGRGDGPCHRSGERAFVGAGGNRKRTAFPRPCGTVPRRPAGPVTPAGQRPTRRARSVRHGRGGRWPGALGPRRAKDQRGAVAGAMAPAMAATQFRPLRAGTGNACVSPARARRLPADRQVREKQRPAPNPADGKRPPGAGRALAGGFGSPACHGSAGRCGRGDGPCEDAQGAHRRKRFPPFRSGMRCGRPFSAPCQTRVSAKGSATI
jgi:hypothetical protein